MNQTKEELRKSILEKRLALPDDKIHLLSKPIQEKLIKHPFW
ncbi:MAG: 5-formyltetrahydrofolate cyclo-ligase, partial [Deltaproteobacteria bacterium]|nr:5-formyltetrahydrofolate cyclo-ligase [Deltaproteobacteria bacterium]